MRELITESLYKKQNPEQPKFLKKSYVPERGLYIRSKQMQMSLATAGASRYMVRVFNLGGRKEKDSLVISSSRVSRVLVNLLTIDSSCSIADLDLSDALEIPMESLFPSICDETVKRTLPVMLSSRVLGYSVDVRSVWYI